MIVIANDLKDLSRKAAAEFVRIANDSIEKKGKFVIALSGGSTPRALNAQLLQADLDWSKCEFFFGDERNVPPDHADSNFRMANETLLEPLRIAKEKIHRWKTELLKPNEVANDYESKVKDVKFDLVLLGMGADGHTASLFPGTEALKETKRNAVANWVPKLDAWRYTLTFPIINDAANVIFLVAGEDKAETLVSVIESEGPPDELPSRSVKPTNGELFWFLDEAAAKHLDKNQFAFRS